MLSRDLPLIDMLDGESEVMEIGRARQDFILVSFELFGALFSTPFGRPRSKPFCYLLYHLVTQPFLS